MVRREWQSADIKQWLRDGKSACFCPLPYLYIEVHLSSLSNADTEDGKTGEHESLENLNILWITEVCKGCMFWRHVLLNILRKIGLIVSLVDASQLHSTFKHDQSNSDIKMLPIIYVSGPSPPGINCKALAHCRLWRNFWAIPCRCYFHLTRFLIAWL